MLEDRRPTVLSASAALLVTIVVLTAGCVSAAYGGPLASGRLAGTTKVSVSAIEFAFKFSRHSAPVGKVAFTITDNGSLPHDMRIDGKTSPLIGPGSSTTLTVTFTKPGRYFYECTVPGHAAEGMEGYFTVTK